MAHPCAFAGSARALAIGNLGEQGREDSYATHRIPFVTGGGKGMEPVEVGSGQSRCAEAGPVGRALTFRDTREALDGVQPGPLTPGTSRSEPRASRTPNSLSVISALAVPSGPAALPRCTPDETCCWPRRRRYDGPGGQSHRSRIGASGIGRGAPWEALESILHQPRAAIDRLVRDDLVRPRQCAHRGLVLGKQDGGRQRAIAFLDAQRNEMLVDFEVEIVEDVDHRQAIDQRRRSEVVLECLRHALSADPGSCSRNLHQETRQ